MGCQKERLVAASNVMALCTVYTARYIIQLHNTTLVPQHPFYTAPVPSESSSFSSFWSFLSLYNRRLPSLDSTDCLLKLGKARGANLTSVCFAKGTELARHNLASAQCGDT